MSDTGGGHRASAQALKAGFHAQFADQFQVDIIDLLTDHLPPPFNRLPDWYPFLSTQAVWLWRLLWQTGRYPRQVRSLADLIANWVYPPVYRAFRQYAPDLIVSVHPLMQEVSLRARSQLERLVPVATVVTDLVSTHPLWFHPGVDRCFVASEAAHAAGMRSGLSAAQLRLYGLPVRPAFAAERPPPLELRHKLGLHPHLPAALLMGGGEGMGPVAAIAQAVAHRLSTPGGPCGQLVVICGRNQRLQRQLSAHTWPLPVSIQGFVENMPEWMGACDCIITKAGPGTIAEALICGLPIVLSGFIPGQETGNVPYVVENRVGAYHRDPSAIAEIVARWFGPEAELRQQYAANARRLGHPQATAQIVTSLVELIDQPRPLTPD
jgi:1,2-diacylglycerol 3-beta-galactosyltransferase